MRHAVITACAKPETRADGYSVANRIFSSLYTSMRARDADWLAARYLPGAPVVGPTPPLTRIADPRGDVPRLWEWFRLLQGRIGWSVRIQQVRVDGDRATCHCVEHVSVRGWMQRRARLTSSGNPGQDSPQTRTVLVYSSIQVPLCW